MRKLNELIEHYRTALADPPEKVIPLLVNTRAGKALAVPVAERRKSGDLDYGTDDADEAFEIAGALENLPGFDNVRVTENVMPGADNIRLYSVHWGEHPGTYPSHFGDVEAHRILGKSYGYKVERIQEFIEAAEIGSEMFRLSVQEVEGFAAKPLKERIAAITKFSGISNFHLFGAYQGGILTPFKA